MSVTAPTTEQGYVISKGNTWSWWPDLDESRDLPELAYPGNLDTFDAMALDPQVTSTLSAVTLPLRSTGWWLDANGADADVVQLISEDLGLPVRGVDALPPARSRDRFSFAEHLDLALDSLTYGHSVFEIVARVVGSQARLRKLGHRPPRTISKWDVARDGGLRGVQQYDSPMIPVDRLVVYTHQRRGGAWQGRSVLRTSYKPWLLKERMLRVQMLSVDRTGVGTPIYEAAPTPEWLMNDLERAEQYASDQQAAGLALAEQYQSGERAGAAIPAGAKFTVAGVTGNLPDAEKVIRYYDEQIARSVLANFLSLGGENSRGSYALGTTFADFFVQSLQAEATTLCDVLTQHVVEDIVDWNWGPDARAPRVVCDDIGSKHPVTAEAITQLVNAGAIQADAELERYLRDTYGINQRSNAWGKGDLDQMKVRVEIFQSLMSAGASFDAAAATSGLSSLMPAVGAEQDSVARTLQQIYLAVGSVITQDEAREIANRVGANLPIPAPKEDA